VTNYLPTCKQSGAGPSVLFLHGLGGNRHAFDHQLNHLSGHYHCVAWDTPGYGDSMPMPEMSFEALAASVDNLIDQLGIEPYAVVGHSMGGMIAQTWLRQGGRAQKLVLAQSSARFGKPGSEWNQKFLAARRKPLDQGQKPADFARSLIESMLHDPGNLAAIESGVATMAPLPAQVYRQVIECLITFDETASLQHIDIPTLCLAAQYDTTAPAENVEKMAQAIPHARYLCLPDAGHLAYIETPQAFSAALAEFLGT